MKQIAFLLVIILSVIALSAQDTIIRNSYYFDLDKYEIEEFELDIFKIFDDTITKYDVKAIIITGYCDDHGSDEYNNILSMKRANYIQDAIILVRPSFDSIIDVYAKGEIPLEESEIEYETQRKGNRRADVEIYASKIIPPKVEVTEPENETEKSFDNVKVGDKIAFENILFYGGKHKFYRSSFYVLDKITEALKDHPEYHVKILGHVCCGRDEGFDYDTGKWDLSEARAKAVYDYLIEHGIDKNRLSFEGLAGRFPTGKGDDADRRVEIEIVKIEEQE
jgi:outer membrane protein OmpA-like peptidoglycan-associated protein